MRVKKYIVDNLAEAMQEIKQDLGHNAVILDTKKVKKRGFLGLFGKKTQIEVIAAADQGVNQNQHFNSQPVRLRRERRLKGAVASPGAHHALPAAEHLVLTQEIKEIKQFMLNMMDGVPLQMPPALRQVDQKLKQHGVLPDIRAQLLQQLLTHYQGHNDQLDSRQIRKFLVNYLETLPLGQQRQLSKFMCFVGPTGVGKTTTIAKLAAEILLSRRQNVGLITADTYRIAAVDQLKTYAQILNVPLEVVYSAQDLKAAMSRLASCDYILMDTAGRNYMEAYYIHELKQLVPDQQDVHTCLVLSLTSKYEDMKQVVVNFKVLPINTLILTKADETHTLGSLVNLLSEYRLPLAYVTNGQNVPDDLLSPSPEWLANTLLSEGIEVERSS
ncbi:flagellar biosynthesis protein FlhF [Caldalkalibacillus uzonensis]|nr:flagellar biosynthesis protein FlhF [Caldalkalibacillus uzonensis]